MEHDSFLMFIANFRTYVLVKTLITTWSVSKFLKAKVYIACSQVQKKKTQILEATL